MGAAQRFKATLSQLRILVEEKPDHWWVRVTDIDHPGILFQTQTNSLAEAQARATEFCRQHLLPEVDGQEDALPTELDWELETPQP